MQAAEQVTFGGGGLDRQAHRRGETAQILSGPAARVLPLWRGRVLMKGEATQPGLVTLPPGHALLDTAPGPHIFLGAAAGHDLFAADLSGWEPETPASDAGPGFTNADQPVPAMPGLSAGARFADLRGLMAGLSPLEAELAATARGILEWHRIHGFCANCGAPSDIAEGGWQRLCPACGRSHFPRTDPVVIMLVTRGNSVLLGRSPGWPDSMYSLLAGFMEPGETVAMAVRREVAEEVGIPVGAVRMLASQPWPFPASLMIGCLAEATRSEIAVDPAEIEDALWVSREEALEIFAGQHPRIAAPRKGAIAGFLFQMWLADRLD